MNPEPKFIFGGSYAIFFGESSQNVFHENAAFQVILSIRMAGQVVKPVLYRLTMRSLKMKVI